MDIPEVTAEFIPEHQLKPLQQVAADLLAQALATMAPSSTGMMVILDAADSTLEGVTCVLAQCKGNVTPDNHFELVAAAVAGLGELSREAMPPHMQGAAAFTIGMAALTRHFVHMHVNPSTETH